MDNVDLERVHSFIFTRISNVSGFFLLPHFWLISFQSGYIPLKCSRLIFHFDWHICPSRMLVQHNVSSLCNAIICIHRTNLLSVLLYSCLFLIVVWLAFILKVSSLSERIPIWIKTLGAITLVFFCTDNPYPRK